MAISVMVRPALIVAGTAVSVAPRLKYDEATQRRTDEVVGYNVTVQQDHGAQVVVRYSDEDVVPSVLTPVAVVVDVQESRQFGAFLVFSRNVIADDLDRINSQIPQPVKG